MHSQPIGIKTLPMRITANHIRRHEEYIVMHHEWSQYEFSQYRRTKRSGQNVNSVMVRIVISKGERDRA